MYKAGEQRWVWLCHPKYQFKEEVVNMAAQVGMGWVRREEVGEGRDASKGREEVGGVVIEGRERE